MRKQEVLNRIEESRSAFTALVESVPPERRDEPGASGEWSLRETIVHINYWQGQLVTLLYQVRQGQKPATVQSDLNLDVDRQNARWHELGKTRTWEAAWADYQALGRQIPRRVAEFSDDELARLRFAGRDLATIIANDTWDHLEEHARDLRAWRGV